MSPTTTKKTILGIIIFIVSTFILNSLIYFIVCIINNIPFKNYPILYRENFSIQNYLKEQSLREPIGTQYNYPGITILGCGFAYGLYLNNNETLAANLSDSRQCPVYNLGIGGSYIQHAILMLRNHILDDEIKNSNYIIYINSAEGDYLRLTTYPGNFFDFWFLLDKYIYPASKIDQEGNIQFINYRFPIIQGFILYRLINKAFNTILFENIPSIRRIYEKNMILHIKELNQEIKKINPNAKLIIFFYFGNKHNYTNIISEIKEDNIIFVCADNLIDNFDKYIENKERNKENLHPNKKDWLIITPKLNKFINSL